MERNYHVPSGAMVPVALLILVLALWQAEGRPSLLHEPQRAPTPTLGVLMPPTQATPIAGVAQPSTSQPPALVEPPSTAVSAPVADTILQAARDSLGQQMWLRHSDLVDNGIYGCASSVTGVLQRAGIYDADTALVSEMRKQLLARPNTQEILLKSPGDPYLDNREMLALLRPGDIIVGTIDSPEQDNAGAAAHTAIYVSPELVYSNNSDDGTWIEADTHALFDRFTYVEAIRIE